MTGAVTDADGAGRARWLRLAVGVVALTALVALAWGSGLGELVRDQDRFEARVDEWGAWGPIGFVALFTLLVPVGVPGLLFMVPAILIWSAPTAFAVSLAGGLTSSSVGIVLARYVARSSFAHRLPPRFHRLDRFLSRRGIWGVIVIRVFTHLNPAADWLIGLSSVPMSRVLLGTAIGLAVPTAFMVFLGAEAVELFLGSAAGGAMLAGAGVAALAGWLWYRRRHPAPGLAALETVER